MVHQQKIEANADAHVNSHFDQSQAVAYSARAVRLRRMSESILPESTIAIGNGPYTDDLSMIPKSMKDIPMIFGCKQLEEHVGIRSL